MHTIAEAIFRFGIALAVKPVIIHRRFYLPKTRRGYPQFAVVSLPRKCRKSRIHLFVIRQRNVVVCGKRYNIAFHFRPDGIADKIAVFVIFVVGKGICAEKGVVVYEAVEKSGICPAVNILPAKSAKLPAKGAGIRFGKSADEVYAEIPASAAYAGLQLHIRLFDGGEVVGNGVFRLCRQCAVNRRKKPRLLLFVIIGKAAAFRRVRNGRWRKLLRRCLTGKSAKTAEDYDKSGKSRFCKGLSRAPCAVRRAPCDDKFGLFVVVHIHPCHCQNFNFRHYTQKTTRVKCFCTFSPFSPVLSFCCFAGQVRAATMLVTVVAPALFRVLAISFRVAPVVITSSTITMLLPLTPAATNAPRTF